MIFQAVIKLSKYFQLQVIAQDVLKKDNLLYIAQGEGGLLIVNVDRSGKPADLFHKLQRMSGVIRVK